MLSRTCLGLVLFGLVVLAIVHDPQDLVDFEMMLAVVAIRPTVVCFLFPSENRCGRYAKGVWYPSNVQVFPLKVAGIWYAFTLGPSGLISGLSRCA